MFFGGSGEGGSGWGGGVRVDVNEVSFCENSKKNIFFFWGGGWAGEGGGCQIRGGVGEGVAWFFNFYQIP